MIYEKMPLCKLLLVLSLIFVVGCGNSTSLEGKVEEGRGQPLANMKVVAKMSQPIKGHEQFETTTLADGSFKFVKLLPKSEYQLIFYYGGEREVKRFIIDSGPAGQTKILPEKVLIRFTYSKEGVVSDTKMNLMWAAKDSGAYTSWANAKFYCENYREGGYTDWRMPTQDELAGLYDTGKTYQSECRYSGFWGSRRYDIRLTEYIRLTCMAPWASETRGSQTAYFHFSEGGRYWDYPSNDDRFRALPVRSAK